MSNTETKLDLITKRSVNYPRERFTALAHHLNQEYLMECYQELKKGKAAGIDGLRKEDYSDQEIE